MALSCPVLFKTQIWGVQGQRYTHVHGCVPYLPLLLNKACEKVWDEVFLSTQTLTRHFLPDLPHIQVWTQRQGRELSLFEEYAGKGTFLRTWPFVKSKTKLCWTRQKKRWWKISASFFPSSFHLHKIIIIIIKNTTENLECIPRESIMVMVSSPSGLQRMKLVEPALSRPPSPHAPLIATAAPLLILQAFHHVFKQKLGYHFCKCQKS